MYGHLTLAPEQQRHCKSYCPKKIYNSQWPRPKAVVNELLYDYTFKIPLPEPPKDYINCKNGVLSLKGPRLLPDSEVNELEAYFRVQLDFEYQKKLTEEDLCKTSGESYLQQRRGM